MKCRRIKCRIRREKKIKAKGMKEIRKETKDRKILNEKKIYGLKS